LIVANANGRRRVDDLRRKVEFAEELGLNSDEFIMTSLLADEEYKIESELPNKVCAELMQMSNLFVFPTLAEVSSNVLLEASMTKQLLVLNSDLMSLFDFVDKSAVLSHPFTSNRSMHYSGRDNESLGALAKKIIGEIDSNKADKQFRHVWKTNNATSIYKNMISKMNTSIYNNMISELTQEQRHQIYKEAKESFIASAPERDEGICIFIEETYLRHMGSTVYGRALDVFPELKQVMPEIMPERITMDIVYRGIRSTMRVNGAIAGYWWNFDEAGYKSRIEAFDKLIELTKD
jgi:hypothetical protein